MLTLRGFRSICIAVAFLLTGLPRAARAQPAANETREAAAAAAPEATVELLQAHIAQVNASKDLDDKAKQGLLELYQKAQAELERAAELSAQAAKFKLATQKAPALLREVRAALDAPPALEQPEAASDASLAQLETRLTQAQSDLAQAQEELTRLEAEPQRRTEGRLKQIPAQLEAANNKLEEIQKQLAAPAAAEESKEMIAARQLLLSARRQAVVQEIACATNERENYNAEDELLPKQQDLAQRKVETRKQQVVAWQKILHQCRQQEAEAKLDKAQQEKQDAYPELRGIAAENEELAKRVSAINNDVAAASKQTVEFTNALNDLQREFKGVTDKVALGLAQQLGPYLLQFRVELERRRRTLDALRIPQSLAGSVRLELMDLVEQRKKLADIDVRAEEVLNRLDLEESPAPRKKLLSEVRLLLQNRRELLDSLKSAYERYILVLAPLLAADKQLFDEISSQADYIDERILWVRSTSKLGRADLSAAADALRWYARPQEWSAAGRQLKKGLAANTLSAAAALALFLALLAAQPKMRRHVRQLGDQAARGTADDMSVTLRALALTLLMTAPWPILLASLAWLLTAAPPGCELAKALAHGLDFTAGAVASIEFLRQVCRGRGLGTAHFAWPEQSARLMRKHLRWFMPLAFTLTLLAGTTHALENDRWQVLGRLLFIVAMAVLSLFIHRVLRPNGGVLHEVLAYHRGAWLDRIHYVMFPLLVASPAALALLAGLGYYYTARQLAWRLQATAWLMVAFLIAGALSLRWLLIMRRRLAIRQARARRAAAQCEQRGPDGAELPSLAGSGEGELDLTTINLQTRRFVQTALLAGFAAGLGLIWAEVLPALSFLNVPIWQTSVEDANGPHLEPINVVRLLEALAAMVLTVVATRNIPGLLEILLLQRLPLEPATRYAVTTLFRYAIAVAGIVIVCVAVGLTWAKIHWLVAAVSVGLGFGLQEIFANFISGLIILFERPIRVGDIVTVGDVSGVVARIRIRATMITDFDRKELIVPNKEFITGRVLNWTLSDQMNRVTVNVGVAYGSDVEKARDLLLQAATENPYVLSEPAPMASFEGFGDSALNLVLRCYLPTFENRGNVTHDLHSRIHDTFREAGIDIAFPQLDLHIRSSPVALYQRQAG